MAAQQKRSVRRTHFASDLSSSVYGNSKKKHRVVIEDVCTAHDDDLPNDASESFKKTHSIHSSKFFYSISKSVVELLSPNSGEDACINSDNRNANVTSLLPNANDSHQLDDQVVNKDEYPKSLLNAGQLLWNAKEGKHYLNHFFSRFMYQNWDSCSPLLESCSSETDRSLFGTLRSKSDLFSHGASKHVCPNKHKWKDIMAKVHISGFPKSPQHFLGKIGRQQISVFCNEVSWKRCHHVNSSRNEAKIILQSDSNNNLPLHEIEKSPSCNILRDCNINIISDSSPGRNLDNAEANPADKSSTRLNQLMYILRTNKIASRTFNTLGSEISIQEPLVPISSRFISKQGDSEENDSSLANTTNLASTNEKFSVGSYFKEYSVSSFPRVSNNAMAGALAGVLVSLCLHPIDTVKTVIQFRTAGQASLFHNLGSIVSERGMTGLYRGIGSNLASSAPISGVYTFTYEFMKGALLPYVAKEYHGFAHCIAGGCASVATSFIYTPSERIKQQMQVGSQHRSSWRALTDILRRGGISSLYVGWSAVLCRNVPQSVIKFYTYEGLKQLALQSSGTQKNLTTLQTLVFGGVAGSTAALFTTPFDVIKTRLQTQTAKSQRHYNGVVQAFCCIAKQEGIGSLYRGLLPRLVIYISQGALFFAAYEFFKQFMSIQAQQTVWESSEFTETNNVDPTLICEFT